MKSRTLIWILVCDLVASAGCAPPPEATLAKPSPSAPPTTIPPPASPTPKPTVRPETPLPSPSATPHIETWTSNSPDGRWIATTVMEGPFVQGADEMYHTQLKVTNSAGSVEWIPVDATSHFGLGYTTPRPFHWSTDGRYLYYTNYPVPDGCALFVNGSDLYRVDLTDGRVETTLPTSSWWLSISPDEQTLAYLYWNGSALEVVLRDIASGEEHRAALDAKHEQAGDMAWSPDGQSLMLVSATRPCLPPEWVQSVIRIDAATLEQTTLIDGDARLFTIEEWPEAGRLVLRDTDGNRWWMEAATGEVVPAP